VQKKIRAPDADNVVKTERQIRFGATAAGGGGGKSTVSSMARPRVTAANGVTHQKVEEDGDEPLNKKRKPIMAPESFYQPPAGKYSDKVDFDIKRTFYVGGIIA
jgi:hypothetical protein